MQAPQGVGAVSNAVIRRSVCLMHARSPKQCILRSMGYYSIKKTHAGSRTHGWRGNWPRPPEVHGRNGHWAGISAIYLTL